MAQKRRRVESERKLEYLHVSKRRFGAEARISDFSRRGKLLRHGRKPARKIKLQMRARSHTCVPTTICDVIWILFWFSFSVAFWVLNPTASHSLHDHRERSIACLTLWYPAMDGAAALHTNCFEKLLDAVISFEREVSCSYGSSVDI